MSKKSLAVKIICFGYIGLLIVLILGAFMYLLVGPDFTAPAKEEKPVTDTAVGDYTIYEYTVDDFYQYMIDKGMWTQDAVDNKISMTTIGSVNYIIDKVDFIWWDLDNMIDGSTEAEYWKEFNENEEADDMRYIMFGGVIYAPQFNGPFACNVNSGYSGDSAAFYKALAAFPGENPKNHIQDFADYMSENGVIAADTTPYEMDFTVGSANRIYSGIELVWWDLDSINDTIDTLSAKDEASLTDEEKTSLSENKTLLANYNSIKDTGKVSVNEKELSYTINENFAIRITEDFEGDADAAKNLFLAWDRT